MSITAYGEWIILKMAAKKEEENPLGIILTVKETVRNEGELVSGDLEPGTYLFDPQLAQIIPFEGTDHVAVKREGIIAKTA